MCNTTDQNGGGMHVDIDVPDTGAVFTLGKSYLFDDTIKEETTPQIDTANHPPPEANGKDDEPNPPKEDVPMRQQSYFFVKNDPIVKIVCGSKQSGVICESGRLFVWGLSGHGQLGLGKTETIHKPSCVRTIKRLKERVQSFSFGGNGFCVILAESGRVFYSGKNVFPFNAKVSSLLEATTLHKNPTDNSEFTPFPVELREFNNLLDEGTEERFTEIVAGFNHFILLSSCGNCYGWGYNSHQQLGGVDSLKILSQPERIALDESVGQVFCGNYCTLFVTVANTLYLVGKFQKITIPMLKQLENCILPEKVISGEITGWDCVYLLLASGQVYRSNRVRKVEDLKFEPFENLTGLLADDEHVTKIASANDCVSFVTSSGRLLTTYDEDCPFTASDHFKELNKFRHFNVTDIASGNEHSLVLAYPAVERLDVTHALELLRNATPLPTELQMDAAKAQEFIRNEKRRLRREHVEREISKDESITIETSERGDSDVRFIDNGVSITPAVTPSGKHHKRNHHLKPADAVDADDEADRFSAHRDVVPRKTHTPNISQLIDYSDDDNDSISSQSTFHDEEEENEDTGKHVGKHPDGYNGQNKTGINNDSNNNRNEDARKLSLGSKLNGSMGSTKSSDRMRKFFKELKSKSMDVSCKNPGVVLDDDIKYSKNDQIIQAEDRASKVCTLM
ncbi:X-linked retinitis pigmentosa GTPase regulator [Anopheles maculipalpis]|uniref:X-linked retinitis pigmentosa GTPase regulator n=1 Tax=Anopheles maculipalpis TaxID=1496333 RepID=UPI0021594937|nr:X-linked retinitis pigmentosa GTPase regulator [Anopheles maculipalpis]